MKLDLQELIEAETKIYQLVEDVKRILEGYTLPLTPRTDSEFLSKFIRVKKYNTAKAAKAVKNYYDHIFRNLQRLEGIKPSDFLSAYESNAFCKLRTTHPRTKLFYIHIRNWDTSKCNIHQLNESVAFITEELAENKEIQLYGSTFIYNIDGLHFSHLGQCSALEIKYLIKLVTESIPTRMEAIHVVNAPWIYWPVHMLVMRLLSVKMRNRIHLHANMESLYKFVDKNILPKSLGGPLAEDDVRDKELITGILTRNRAYDAYWSVDYQG